MLLLWLWGRLVLFLFSVTMGITSSTMFYYTQIIQGLFWSQSQVGAVGDFWTVRWQRSFQAERLIYFCKNQETIICFPCDYVQSLWRLKKKFYCYEISVLIADYGSDRVSKLDICGLILGRPSGINWSSTLVPSFHICMCYFDMSWP